MAETIKRAHLVKKVLFAGSIEALTGIHVGGSEAGLSIGGADKLVVRDPRTNQPYLPGSSLRGKLRSLLEKARCAAAGCLAEKQKLPAECGPCKCGHCEVCVVFGISAGEAGDAPAAAGRLLVRDAFLLNAAELERLPNLDMPFTEVKTEVSIDRITSRANPRQFERVPAGARFGFEFALNIFEDDNEQAFRDLVMEGLRLTAHDAVGGQGSRGYGQVRIGVDRITSIPIDCYRDETALRQAQDKNELTQSLVYGDRLSAPAAAA